MKWLKEKAGTLWHDHKIKVIVYAALFCLAIIANRIILKSVYDYTVDQYEQYGSCAQVCEDGIATFRRMKYYKQAKNYIRQMTITGVEDYCNDHDYAGAVNFLNEYYDESYEYLYEKISTSKKEYEEEQERLKAEQEEAARKAKYDSVEGRTERVKKMYKTMGLGGVDNGNLIMEIMTSRIENASLALIGDLLPVWNRNDTYFQMLMDWYSHAFNWVEGNSLRNMWVQEVRVSDKISTTPAKYKAYLRKTYKIDIDVQDVQVWIFMLCQSDTMGSWHGQEFEMISFKTDGKCFFGGIFVMSYDNELQSLTPGNAYYSGIITDE